MIFTKFTKEALAVRRENRRMEALGYGRHETNWEIIRGFFKDHRIVDAKISIDGRAVWTKIGPRA
jgi:hypothetical protein